MFQIHKKLIELLSKQVFSMTQNKSNHRIMVLVFLIFNSPFLLVIHQDNRTLSRKGARETKFVSSEPTGLPHYPLLMKLFSTRHD